MGETTAQCHCGGVRFTVKMEHYGAVLCHCRDYHQVHGNDIAMAAAPREAVVMEAEEHAGLV